jgi:hypothetical protein
VGGREMKLKIFAAVSLLYFYHPLWFALLLTFGLFYEWKRHLHRESSELDISAHDSYFPGCRGLRKEHAQ